MYVTTEEEILLKIRSGAFRLLRKYRCICIAEVKWRKPQNHVMVAKGANDAGRDDTSIRIRDFPEEKNNEKRSVKHRKLNFL
jgi:hypothetical protein